MQSVNRRSSGFIPLDGGPAGGNMHGENGIPLTTVRSNASTGNRKPNPANTSSFDSSQNENEKHHHLHHRHGRRRRADDSLGRKGTGGSDEFRLNAMGRVYAKIVGFSVVSRYLVYIVPIGLVLAVPIIVLVVTGHQHDVYVGTSEDKNGNKRPGPTLFNLFLWIEITWLSIWAAKVVAWLLPQTFMFFCGIVSAGTRKYAMVLKNLVLTLSFFFWALATWITFNKLFNQTDRKNASWVDTLSKILGALFVSSAVLLVEKAIVQVISVSYHQRSFANRIKESKREIHLLGLMYDASRTLFPMYCPEFSDEDYVINDSIEMMLGAKVTGHKRAGSATPLRILGQAGRVGDKVTSAFGNFASEITGKKIFNPNSAHSIVLGALEKLRPSEALARRIWLSFVLEGRESLYLDDFHEVLGPAYRSEAEEAFNFIDSDMNGDVSLEEMVQKIVNIGKERKAIAEGMKDIGQALQAFDKVLLFVVLLIVIFVFLAFFKSSFLTVVASAGTALLSLSFIFAVTCQEFLGSCIFLFVKHPYDVGDRVDINGVELVVDRISLLYTVFTRIDTMQISQIPNIQLNNYWVDNISRSKAMVESVQLEISYDTSFEDVELLRMEMEKFVRSPDNSRDFQRDFNIGIGGIGNLDKLVLQMSIKHKSNWHNYSIRSTRRSKFMCALAVAMKKVPINAPGGGGDPLGGAANPSYSVAVTDDFAAAKRNESAQSKDTARMVPKSQNQKTEEETQEAEKQAIGGINTRQPLVDDSEMWGNNPEQPQTSADAYEQRQRSESLAAVRTELVKSRSQSGRRKAGEGLPSLASMDSNNSGGAGGSVARNSSNRMSPFDEEAETDMPTSYYELNRTRSGQSTSGHSQRYLQPSASQRSRGPGQPPRPPPPAGQH